MRYRCVILPLAAAACLAAAEPPVAGSARWEREGQALFLACEYKQAARAFEKAVAVEPGSGTLNFWLGKSYARLADVSSPLSAPRNARKARRSLERAVRIEPQNNDYLLELFELYVDSPQWFRGGLERAGSVMDSLSRTHPGGEVLLEQIAESKHDHSGVVWRTGRVVLWTLGLIGWIASPR